MGALLLFAVRNCPARQGIGNKHEEAPTLPLLACGLRSPGVQSGVLVAVAVPAEFARITPVWSVKKYLCPVVPGLVGAALIV